jgi:hypothetical protein
VKGKNGIVLRAFVSVELSVPSPMQEVEAFNDFYNSCDYAKRLQLALTVFAVFGSYLHLVVRRLAPGWVALAASAPVFLVNLFLPLLFSRGDDEMLSRGICVVAAPFLGNLKVWCCLQCCCLLQLLHSVQAATQVTFMFSQSPL